MTGAYKFTSDYGYGALDGLFIEDSADVDFLIKYGDKIYFYAGEVLGKYSEISDYIHTCDIQVLSTDENIVNIYRVGKCYSYRIYQISSRWDITKRISEW